MPFLESLVNTRAARGSFYVVVWTLFFIITRLSIIIRRTVILRSHFLQLQDPYFCLFVIYIFWSDVAAISMRRHLLFVVFNPHVLSINFCLSVWMVKPLTWKIKIVISYFLWQVRSDVHINFQPVVPCNIDLSSS